MRIARDKIASLCQTHGLPLAQLFREAGVSPNAFYTLARKETVVPRSLTRIAERLGVSAAELLEEAPTPRQRMERLLAESNRIAKRHRGVERDNIRHTLLLLDEKPIERLRRALRRGRPIDLR